MKLHADLTQRAVVDSNSLAWIDSPLAGVTRRMLERDGEEVARATSLVSYAPGSFFSAHTHGGGEEFLVLDGVFADELGQYPRGMYVRNPPGSAHAPSSPNGCILLVKLRQMRADDQAVIRIDSTRPELWRETTSGESELVLFDAAHEHVSLRRWPAGSQFAPQHFNAGAEYFVLEGSFRDRDDTYHAGTWLRLPRNTEQTISSDEGALVYRKSGHL